MAISYEPLSKHFGVQVSDVDVDALTDDDKQSLYDAFLHHGLLLFRDLPLTLDQHVALTRVFGEPEPHPMPALRHPVKPEILVLAGESGKGVGWHMDLIYRKNPSAGALLRPIVIPEEGGQTAWIDRAKVYAALSNTMKEKVSDLQVVMSYGYYFDNELKERSAEILARYNGEHDEEGEGTPVETERFPDVTHPLVYRQPETGDPVLNVSPSFAKEIVGLPKGEGDALLSELQTFATREEFSYTHDWQEGDLALWNNWRTMHRGYGHQHQRVMYRTTIEGGALS